MLADLKYVYKAMSMFKQTPQVKEALLSEQYMGTYMYCLTLHSSHLVIQQLLLTVGAANMDKAKPTKPLLISYHAVLRARVTLACITQLNILTGLAMVLQNSSKN